jgi:hypothetical protein
MRALEYSRGKFASGDYVKVEYNRFENNIHWNVDADPEGGQLKLGTLTQWGHNTFGGGLSFGYNVIYDDPAATLRAKKSLWMDRYGQILTDTTTPTISQTIGGLAAANVDHGSFLTAPTISCAEAHGTLASSHETQVLDDDGPVDGPEQLPSLVTSLKLWGAIPNPARQGASIYFDVPSDVRQPVEVSVFNVAGRKLFTTGEAVYPPGRHMIPWRTGGRPVPAGIYFVRLSVDQNVEIKKVVVVE